jgi:hypothetical protein
VRPKGDLDRSPPLEHPTSFGRPCRMTSVPGHVRCPQCRAGCFSIRESDCVICMSRPTRRARASRRNSGLGIAQARRHLRRREMTDQNRALSGGVKSTFGRNLRGVKALAPNNDMT